MLFRSASTTSAVTSTADLQSLDPERMLIDAHRLRHGADPEPDLLRAFREVLLAEATQA